MTLFLQHILPLSFQNKWKFVTPAPTLSKLLNSVPYQGSLYLFNKELQSGENSNRAERAPILRDRCLQNWVHKLPSTLAGWCFTFCYLGSKWSRISVTQESNKELVFICAWIPGSCTRSSLGEERIWNREDPGPQGTNHELGTGEGDSVRPGTLGRATDFDSGGVT